jgi:hypothetical protein
MKPSQTDSLKIKPICSNVKRIFPRIVDLDSSSEGSDVAVPIPRPFLALIIRPSERRVRRLTDCYRAAATVATQRHVSQLLYDFPSPPILLLYLHTPVSFLVFHKSTVEVAGSYQEMACQFMLNQFYLRYSFLLHNFVYTLCFPSPRSVAPLTHALPEFSSKTNSVVFSTQENYTD